MLLDLIGARNPVFPVYFLNTARWFGRLESIGKNILQTIPVLLVKGYLHLLVLYGRVFLTISCYHKCCYKHLFPLKEMFKQKLMHYRSIKKLVIYTCFLKSLWILLIKIKTIQMLPKQYNTDLAKYLF